MALTPERRQPFLRDLRAVIVGLLELERSGQGPPELFMGTGIMASVDGSHPRTVEFETAHQIGGGSFAFHQAATARLHLPCESITLLAHDVGTAFEREKIAAWIRSRLSGSSTAPQKRCSS
jgi:hypothetical protein